MLKHYLKITFRAIWKQKGSSFLNIFGLATGIACFIFISMWVIDELSYDQFHQKKDRIFRVNTITDDYGTVTTSSWRLGPNLQSIYPEIENYTRVWPWAQSLIQYNNQNFDEQNIYLVDSTFFSIFSFKFVYGDAESALQDKNVLVVTRSTAARYFENEDPIGKMVFSKAFNDNFKITGVIEDVPRNSEFQFDFLARVDLMPKQRMESWEFTGNTYVLLNKNAEKKTVEAKIASFYKEHVNPETEYAAVLQELTKIHLYADGKPGRSQQVMIFAIIGLFILFIACANFMNLSTARAAKRVQEIGIRKVVGAYRKQLIFQFLGESILFSFIALLLSLLLVELFLPSFCNIAGKTITLASWRFIPVLLSLTGVALMTGILAGLYPAIFLSSFRPARIFKEYKSPHSHSARFRKGLTIFQFAIAVVLVICTVFMKSQINYLQTKNLGINRDCVLSLPLNPTLNDKFETYRNELLKDRNIENITTAQNQLLDVGNFINVNWEGNMDQDPIPMAYTTVRHNFFETFDMRFLMGRGFSKTFQSDEKDACIINETALKLMNLEDPIGKQVYFNHPAFEESLKQVHIIGVVNDFHFRSLHEPVGPFIFRMYQPYQSYVYIKIKPDQLQNSISTIKEITEQFAPDYPFRFEFVDDTYRQLYDAEMRMETVFRTFSFLAILISCLGLFGLVSITMEQHTKEIGVRKVLGATVFKITLLFSKEFLKWVLISNVLAWPVAWVITGKWLEHFEYRIDMTIGPFILAGVSALLIALLTVSWQVIRAATENPIKALRYE